MVNDMGLAVFDKASGEKVCGPVLANTLFAGFGGACETHDGVDPNVMYDQDAGRWLWSQITSSPPFLKCIAVSTTSDATGSYNRYAFDMGPNPPDYPRIGVWPDGYYVSFNMYDGGKLLGGRACVFERSAMLTGEPARQECFDSSETANMVPSDWDGATPPPAGSPNYFVQLGLHGTNVLRLYKLHADFVTPANATFSAPVELPVSSFIPACDPPEPTPTGRNGGDGGPDATLCIPQRGTKQKLVEISDRLMYRAAYRNFGDHDSLVATHTVARVVKGTSPITVNGAAIRWYELRNLSSDATVFQQGTFGPGRKWRWMPSIGMDRAGNIAVGYSTSGHGTFPGTALQGVCRTIRPG